MTDDLDCHEVLDDDLQCDPEPVYDNVWHQFRSFNMDEWRPMPLEPLEFEEMVKLMLDIKRL